jgi:endonuclease/exonuclease/phosphatase family metal-dependent hydrolase
MLSAALCAVVMQSPLTFVSYNIRYATAADGPNLWVFRRAAVFALINSRRPDVLGVQEALATQIDELLVHLPGYAYVGVGRDDGKRAGEYSAVFYRRDRLSVTESGTFWLSDTPEVVGSKSWGNNVVRICTWATMRSTDGMTFNVYNAHFDHESQPSREKSAALLRSRVSGHSVVMGDFNAGEQNAAVKDLLSNGLVDTFRALHSDAIEVGTFNGFDTKATKGDKIDYVLCSPGWKVIDAAIDRTLFDGRAPSDHFPVWAVLSPTT